MDQPAYARDTTTVRVVAKSPALRKAVYAGGKPIFVTVDTSPTRIEWVINQEDEDEK
jgi:hypothetical protein